MAPTPKMSSFLWIITIVIITFNITRIICAIVITTGVRLGTPNGSKLESHLRVRADLGNPLQTLPWASTTCHGVPKE